MIVSLITHLITGGFFDWLLASFRQQTSLPGEISWGGVMKCYHLFPPSHLLQCKEVKWLWQEEVLKFSGQMSCALRNQVLFLLVVLTKIQARSLQQSLLQVVIHFDIFPGA